MGDTCKVHPGAKVRILGFVDHNKDILVERTSMTKELPNSCPNGVLYFQSLAELAKYKQ